MKTNIAVATFLLLIGASSKANSFMMAKRLDEGNGFDFLPMEMPVPGTQVKTYILNQGNWVTHMQTPTKFGRKYAAHVPLGVKIDRKSGQLVTQFGGKLCIISIAESSDKHLVKENGQLNSFEKSNSDSLFKIRNGNFRGGLAVHQIGDEAVFHLFVLSQNGVQVMGYGQQKNKSKKAILDTAKVFSTLLDGIKSVK